jgi:SPP1 family predicted phage head-tail adaptor
MLAGSLRQSVIIQEAVAVPTGTGGSRNSWEDRVTVNAQVTPMSAHAGMLLSQSGAIVSHRVRIRYRDGITNSTHRIVYRGRVLEIATVHDIAERRQMLELHCAEITPGPEATS